MDYKNMKPIGLVRQMLTDGVITLEQAAKYFPELKESECETVRKKLLSFFIERAKYTEDSTFNGLSIKEIIDWLEEQGKQKPVVPKFKVGDFIKVKKDNYGDSTIKIEAIDTENYYYFDKYFDKEYPKLLFLRISEQNDWELVEQKAIEWDESVIDETISLINKLASGYGEKVDEPITFNGVKMINNIKERLRAIQPQPQQEWSEEDEVKLKSALALLSHPAIINDNYEVRVKVIDWLKHLRPQKRLKPSEGQIRELHNIISGCSDDIEPIIELEKKLKELYNGNM